MKMNINLAVMVSVMLAATASAAPLHITDAEGEMMTLPEPPQHIVLAGRGSLMLLHTAALFPEAAERLVAVSAGRLLNRKQMERFTRAGRLPDDLAMLTAEVGPEQLAPLRPDFVVLKTGASRLREACRRVGIPTCMMDIETPASFEHAVTMFGIVFGDTERADALLTYYRTAQEKIAQRLSTVPVEHRPRVLLVQTGSEGGALSFRVPGQEWMQTTMVELAGGQPVWTSMTGLGGWSVMGLEQIAVWNPEVVFVVDYEDPERAVAALRADPTWRLLSAVKAGRLYAVPSDGATWDQPDPRWVLGLTWMAKKLHPGRMADVDLPAALREFYAWYGLTADAVIKEIEPFIAGDWP